MSLLPLIESMFGFVPQSAYTTLLVVIAARLAIELPPLLFIFYRASLYHKTLAETECRFVPNTMLVILVAGFGVGDIMIDMVQQITDIGGLWTLLILRLIVAFAATTRPFIRLVHNRIEYLTPKSFLIDLREYDPTYLDVPINARTQAGTILLALDKVTIDQLNRARHDMQRDINSATGEELADKLEHAENNGITEYLQKAQILDSETRILLTHICAKLSTDGIEIETHMALDKFVAGIYEELKNIE